MNYQSWYEKISAPFRTSRKQMMLDYLNRGCVGVLACGYIASLLWLACTVNIDFWKATLVPLAALGIVSLLRQIINEPRPYETWATTPLIPCTTKGKSLPSRHVTCAVIIAMELAWLWTWAGIIAGFLTLLIMFIRIVGGAHYPRDVISALILAWIVGYIGFYIIA